MRRRGEGQCLWPRHRARGPRLVGGGLPQLFRRPPDGRRGTARASCPRRSSMCSMACFRARPNTMPRTICCPALISTGRGAGMGRLRPRLWPQAALRHPCRYRHQPPGLLACRVRRTAGDDFTHGGPQHHPADEPPRLRRRSRPSAQCESSATPSPRCAQSCRACRQASPIPRAFFWADDFTHDLVRPGIALYGGNPTPGKTNPMQPVATLEGTVLQVRDVQKGETVGYGATWKAPRDQPHRHSGRRLQGWRAARPRRPNSNDGPAQVFIGGKRCPIVGRVSMDMMAIDVTDSAARELARGTRAEILGPNIRHRRSRGLGRHHFL